MTYDEIMALEPGPVLDALVATKVMGWTVEEKTCGPGSHFVEGTRLSYYVNPETGQAGAVHMVAADGEDRGLVRMGPRGLPYYSDSLVAAWEVVEKVTAVAPIRPGRELPDGTVFMFLFEAGHVWAMTAKEAALNVCRWALVAVGA